LGQLQKKDQFCLVDFNSRAKVLFELQALGSEAVKKEALNSVDKLQATGSTNMLDGLQTGLQQLIKAELGGKVASVLLFTDGHPDKKTGIVECVAPLVKQIKGGCTVQTFGYGSDHDGDFLKKVAEEGNGAYYFLEKPDDIPNSFADALGGLLSVVAQNIVLEVTPITGVKIEKVNTVFPVTQSSGKWSIKIPDLYGDEKRDILFDISLSPFATPGNQVLLQSSLCYFNVLESTLFTSTVVDSTIERPEFIKPDQQKIDIKVDEQRNRVLCAEALVNCKKVADGGDLDKARVQLNATIQQVQASPSCAAPETVALLTDLQETAKTLEKKHEYASVGQKKMAMQSQMHQQQRCQSPMNATPLYQTEAKMQMQMNSQVAMSGLNDDRYARRNAAQGLPQNYSQVPSRGQVPSNRHPSQMPQQQKMPSNRHPSQMPVQQQQMSFNAQQQMLSPSFNTQQQMQVPNQRHPSQMPMQQQLPSDRHPSQIPMQQVDQTSPSQRHPSQMPSPPGTN